VYAPGRAWFAGEIRIGWAAFCRIRIGRCHDPNIRGQDQAQNLVINLKTAKRSASTYHRRCSRARADEVIE
jgi:hypothetical protein